jgi:hypothetical protein
MDRDGVGFAAIGGRPIDMQLAAIDLAGHQCIVVPVENLRSKILMVQSTQNWHR